MVDRLCVPFIHPHGLAPSDIIADPVKNISIPAPLEINLDSGMKPFDFYRLTNPSVKRKWETLLLQTTAIKYK